MKTIVLGDRHTGKKFYFNKRFTQGQINSESRKIVFHDLEALKDFRENKEDFDYHFQLLKGNLKDIFNGTKKVKK